MEILLRIPNLRTALYLRLLQWMSDGIHQLKQNDDQVSNTKVLGSGGSEAKAFTVARGSGVPGKIWI